MRDHEREMIYTIKKILKNEAKLFMHQSFVSFTSLESCIKLLKIFHSDLQKECLGLKDSSQYDYLFDISPQMAPFIDDIKWENYLPRNRFFFVEIFLIIGVVTLNLWLEYHYAYLNISALVLYDNWFTIKTLSRLLAILTTQISLTVITVIMLEKSIQMNKFS